MTVSILCLLLTVPLAGLQSVNFLFILTYNLLDVLHLFIFLFKKYLFNTEFWLLLVKHAKTIDPILNKLKQVILE